MRTKRKQQSKRKQQERNAEAWRHLHAAALIKAYERNAWKKRVLGGSRSARGSARSRAKRLGAPATEVPSIRSVREKTTVRRKKVPTARLTRRPPRQPPPALAGARSRAASRRDRCAATGFQCKTSSGMRAPRAASAAASRDAPVADLVEQPPRLGLALAGLGFTRRREPC